MSTLKVPQPQCSNPPQLFENWVKKEQLAQHLACSPSYINKLMCEGLPRTKFGRAVRFRISEVEEWLQRRSN